MFGQRIVTIYLPAGAPSFSPYMLSVKEQSFSTVALGRGSFGSAGSFSGMNTTNAPAAGWLPTNTFPRTGKTGLRSLSLVAPQPTTTRPVNKNPTVLKRVGGREGIATLCACLIDCFCGDSMKN